MAAAPPHAAAGVEPVLSASIGYSALPHSREEAAAHLVLIDAFGDRYDFTYTSPSETGVGALTIEGTLGVQVGPAVVGGILRGTSSGPYGAGGGGVAAGLSLGSITAEALWLWEDYSYHEYGQCSPLQPAWPGDPGAALQTSWGDLVWMRPGERCTVERTSEVRGVASRGYRLTARWGHFVLVASWRHVPTVTMEPRFTFTWPIGTTPNVYLSDSKTGHVRMGGSDVWFIGVGLTL